MMFECPDEIFALFERSEDFPKGRVAVVTWLKSLPMTPGDWVWTPEEGWCMKVDHGFH